MSILFSQKLGQNNEIRPQEAIFTEVLSTIAVTPKMLYFYGKMPENGVKNVVKFTTKNGVKVAERRSNYNTKIQLELLDGLSSGRNFAGQKSQRIVEEVDKKADLAQNVRPKTLAIVGTRKPTAYGREIAYELAYAAAKRGVVVISGLAYGIDSIAHRGALDAGGVTVAVLGTPIDQIYPRAHLGLAEEIVAKAGCVMSELAPGAEFHAKACFLQRNRLISGLADVVVIPEAAERSGSLNTAAHALEQGREIFAVPGDITKPMSAGCNRLIRQGAMPYLGVEDVLEVLFPPESKYKKSAKVGQKMAYDGVNGAGVLGSVDEPALRGDTLAETAILRALASGLRDGEEILAKTGISVVDFNQSTTMLELKGQIRALGANRWCLK